MRVCTLHLPPPADRAGRRAAKRAPGQATGQATGQAIGPLAPPVAVADRFSWAALVFGWLALLRPTAWIAGLLAGAFTIALHGLLAGTAWQWPMLAAIHLSLAAFLPEIRRWQLTLSGWQPAGSVIASSEAAARDRALA